MARVVQLSEKAYAILRAEKGENESYSDVVLRVLRKRDPRTIVGKLGLRGDVERVIRRMRDADLERAKSVWK